MKGGPAPAHYRLALEPREGVALKTLLIEISQDKDFPLNEYEQEIVDSILGVLDQPLTDEKPLNWT